jgi:hypothetical protein
MAFLQVFGAATFGGAVGAAVLYLLHSYFGGYIGRKGANRADLEDSGDLTKIVEAVKSGYSHELAKISEALRSVTAMRLLAGERRLEVHQKVYSIAVDMQTHAFDKDLPARQKLQREWYTFWKENCLYMEAAVRASFLDAATAFHIHLDLIRPPMPRNEEDVRLVIDNKKRMERLASDAEKAVKLPPISDDLTTTFGDLPPG